MSQTPDFIGSSACLLSHCRRREVENRLKIKRFRLRGGSFHGACCPIHFESLDEIAPVPERAAHERRQPGEAQSPQRKIPQVAQKEMREQSDPNLPLDGVLAVADEVVDLAGLLEFFEERFDVPTVAIYFSHGSRGPLQVVRQKHHLLHLPLYFHDGGDAAKRSFVFRRRGFLLRDDDLVGEDLRLLFVRCCDRLLKRFHDLHFHVALLPRHEPHAAFVQAVHEPEVRVGAVGGDDISALQMRGKFGRPHGIVVRGVLHDGEGRQAIAEAERHVELGGGLRAAVLRPVKAVHRETDCGRIDGEHRGLDPEAVSLVRSMSELRSDAGEIPVHFPVQVLRHRGRPHCIGVRERVAMRHGDAHRLPQRLVRQRDIADRIERFGFRHLTVEHRRDVTLGRKRAAEHLVRSRGFGDELVRYQVDNLTDNWVYCLRCFWFGFHTRVGYTRSSPKATLKIIPQDTNGMLVDKIIRYSCL